MWFIATKAALLRRRKAEGLKQTKMYPWREIIFAFMWDTCIISIYSADHKREDTFIKPVLCLSAVLRQEKQVCSSMNVSPLLPCCPCRNANVSSRELWAYFSFSKNTDDIGDRYLVWMAWWNAIANIISAAWLLWSAFTVWAWSPY